MKGIMELLETESGISVRRGVLPDYVRVEDTRANSVETLQVASVLYAGATLTDKESLSMPQREPMPTNGELPLDTEDEKIKPKHRPAPEPKKNNNSFFEKVGKKIGKLFSAPDEDDSDLLDE